MLKNVRTPANIERFFLEKRLPRGDFSELDMEIIWDDIKNLKSGDVVVEIGVRYGKSLGTIALIASDGVEIYGIDIDDLPGRKQFFERSKLATVVNFIHASSELVARIWGKEINVLHVDGDHTYDGVSVDIKSWFPHLADNGVIFFHDCDSTSPGVVRAVEELVKNKNLQVEYFREKNSKTSMARIQL